MTGDDPITLQWYKDGLPLISSPKFTINRVASKMSLLILQGVGSEHSGIYTCRAANKVGEAAFSGTLKIKGNVLSINCHCSGMLWCLVLTGAKFFIAIFPTYFLIRKLHNSEVCLCFVIQGGNVNIVISVFRLFTPKLLRPVISNIIFITIHLNS